MILKKRKYRTIDMFLLMYRITPVYSTLVILEKIIVMLMPAVTIYVTAYFIDTAKAIVTEGTPQSKIITSIALLIAITLISSIQGYLIGFVQVKMEIKSRVKMWRYLIYQIMAILLSQLYLGRFRFRPMKNSSRTILRIGFSNHLTHMTVQISIV